MRRRRRGTGLLRGLGGLQVNSSSSHLVGEKWACLGSDRFLSAATRRRHHRASCKTRSLSVGTVKKKYYSWCICNFSVRLSNGWPRGKYDCVSRRRNPLFFYLYPNIWITNIWVKKTRLININERLFSCWGSGNIRMPFICFFNAWLLENLQTKETNFIDQFKK